MVRKNVNHVTDVNCVKIYKLKIKSTQLNYSLTKTKILKFSLMYSVKAFGFV